MTILIYSKDVALNITPRKVTILFGQGVLKLRKSDVDGLPDIERVLQLDRNINDTFAKYGIRLPQ